MQRVTQNAMQFATHALIPQPALNCLSRSLFFPLHLFVRAMAMITFDRSFFEGLHEEAAGQPAPLRPVFDISKQLGRTVHE
jgi:hypothetical protein